MIKTFRPKLHFEEWKLYEPKALYGAIVFGKKEYPLREFFELLTIDQIRRLKRRLEDELEISMRD